MPLCRADSVSPVGHGPEVHVQYEASRRFPLSTLVDNSACFIRSREHRLSPRKSPVIAPIKEGLSAGLLLARYSQWIRCVI